MIGVCARNLLVLVHAVAYVQAQGSRGVPRSPSFAETIANVTVAAGRIVTLSCVVDNLGSYKVAWIHTNRHMLLSMDRMLITTDPRYQINNNGERTWYLTISPVQDIDKGEYMCQINTNPMKKMIGYLHVVVPPKIDEEFSSSEVTVRESANVSLRCRATGNPHPDIKWRRDHDQMISTSANEKSVSFYHGEYLNITKVTRLQMGPYFCIGANGVPPSVSRRIKVNVAFPPMIWIAPQMVGVPIRDNVNVTCGIEAFPKGEVYWERDDGERIKKSERHDFHMQPRGLEYRSDLVLNIVDIQPEDYGSYKCIAKNPLGETEATVKLFETARPTTSSTTKQTKATRKPKPTRKPSPKQSSTTKSTANDIFGQNDITPSGDQSSKNDASDAQQINFLDSSVHCPPRKLLLILSLIAATWRWA